MSALQHYAQDVAIDELVRLYNKAINNAASLTRVERNIVIRAPPPEIEDALCREECGQDMPTLFAKAVADPSALTSIEAEILAIGVNRPAREEVLLDLQVLARRPQWLQDLMWAAFNAIVTPESIEVKRLAYQQYNEDRSQHTKAEAHKDDRPMWVRMLALALQKGDVERWGYAVFRTSYGNKVKWKQLQNQVEQDAVGMMSVVRADSIADRFQLYWIEDEALKGADQATLQRRFVDVARSLPSGIRRDYFLSVDDTFETNSGAPPMLLMYAAADAESGRAKPTAMAIEQLVSPTYGALVQRNIA